jgi:hypothetical protein
MFAFMVRRGNLIRSKEGERARAQAISWQLMGMHVECMGLFIGCGTSVE